MDRARDYLEWYFRRQSLVPAFPASSGDMGDATETSWMSFRQGFDFRSRPRGADVKLEEGKAAIGDEALERDKEFAVLGISGSGEVRGPLTFVGYAIEAGPEGYSSFGDASDLSGRIAIVLRYEPLDAEGKSRWSETRFSGHAAMEPKMQAVARRRPAGVVLVAPPGCVDGRTRLASMGESLRFGPSLDVPVVQVTEEVANRILAKADPEGRDLLAWRRLADDGAVTTTDLSDGVEMHIAVEIDRPEGELVEAANVGAAAGAARSPTSGSSSAATSTTTATAGSARRPTRARSSPAPTTTRRAPRACSCSPIASPARPPRRTPAPRTRVSPRRCARSCSWPSTRKSAGCTARGHSARSRPSRRER
jgi:hypothetical protein